MNIIEYIKKLKNTTRNQFFPIMCPQTTFTIFQPSNPKEYDIYFNKNTNRLMMFLNNDWTQIENQESDSNIL